jgi:hypothetical protein
MSAASLPLVSAMTAKGIGDDGEALARAVGAGPEDHVVDRLAGEGVDQAHAGLAVALVDGEHRELVVVVEIQRRHRRQSLGSVLAVEGRHRVDEVAALRVAQTDLRDAGLGVDHQDAVLVGVVAADVVQRDHALGRDGGAADSGVAQVLAAGRIADPDAEFFLRIPAQYGDLALLVAVGVVEPEDVEDLVATEGVAVDVVAGESVGDVDEVLVPLGKILDDGMVAVAVAIDVADPGGAAEVLVGGLGHGQRAGQQQRRCDCASAETRPSNHPGTPPYQRIQRAGKTRSLTQASAVEEKIVQISEKHRDSSVPRVIGDSNRDAFAGVTRERVSAGWFRRVAAPPRKKRCKPSQQAGERSAAPTRTARESLADAPYLPVYRTGGGPVGSG